MPKKSTVARPFQVPAEIVKVETRRDGGVRITADTNELAGSEAAAVMSYMRQQGWLLFAPQEIEAEEIQDLPEMKLEEGQTSPSKRLRSVLFVLWKTKPRTVNFDTWYAEYVEKIIVNVKAQLPEQS